MFTMFAMLAATSLLKGIVSLLLTPNMKKMMVHKIKWNTTWNTNHYNSTQAEQDFNHVHIFAPKQDACLYWEIIKASCLSAHLCPPSAPVMTQENRQDSLQE
jgi:hypothetical protein